MAWSRQALKANQGAARGAANVSAGTVSRQVARKRISKRAVPASVDMPFQNNLRTPLAEISAPLPVPRPKTEDVPLEDVPLQNNLQAALTETSEPLPVPRPETEDVPVGDVPMKDVPLKVESLEVPRERGPQEQVAAALVVAELISNAQAPKGVGDDDSDEISPASVDDTSAAPPKQVDARVALVISRSDVKSASALEGSNITIGTIEPGIEDNVRSALAAAGAPDTRLSMADANPMDQLISGDVQAVVLKLVSPDAAEAFPEIKGFKVFRLPLAPH
jgi:hypothetical protein